MLRTILYRLRMDACEISEGRILSSSGVTEYTIHYRAVISKGRLWFLSLPDLILGGKKNKISPL